MKNPELLLSYNIKYGQKMSAILDWFSGLDQKPSVACFQEFPDPKSDTAAEEIAGLGYQVRFAPALVKNGRTYGELTAVKPDFQILKTRSIDFGLNPVEKTVLGLQGRRSALITRIKSEDLTIDIANVHILLLGLYRHRWSQVLAAVNALDRTNPAIVAGDFNNGSIDRWIGKNNLVRDMAAEGFNKANLDGSTFIWNGWGLTLDYIFARNLAIGSGFIGSIGLSDHEPLFVEFGSN